MGKTVGAGFDGRPITRQLTLGDIRFNQQGKLNKAQLASFDLANLDADKRMNLTGEGNTLWIVVGLVAAGVAVCLLADCFERRRRQQLVRTELAGGRPRAGPLRCGPAYAIRRRFRTDRKRKQGVSHEQAFRRDRLGRSLPRVRLARAWRRIIASPASTRRGASPPPPICRVPLGREAKATPRLLRPLARARPRSRRRL